MTLTPCSSIYQTRSYFMLEQIDITIRFYEELNYFIKKYPKKQDIKYTYYGKRSIKDLIENFGIPHVEVDLILVNGESVDFNYIVQNNDRISVYPMFESLNITKTTLLRDKPLRKTKFVIDVHLGKLARNLRLLGFDTDYKSNRNDSELAKISSKENRVLLTRDRQLLMRKIVTHGFIIRNEIPIHQIAEVLNRMDLWESISPFTRCVKCNSNLKGLQKNSSKYNDLKEQIPQKVKEWCKEFSYCSICNKVYWKGTHYTNFLDKISIIKSKQIQKK